MQQQNHNLFFLQGDQTVNDLEVCETMGLDPKYAFTPEINEQAIKKMYNDNIAGYLERGINPAEAEKLAGDLANEARLRVKTAYKDSK